MTTTLLGVFYNPTALSLAPPESTMAGAAEAIPEPASWLMLTLGGIGAGVFRWRRLRYCVS